MQYYSSETEEHVENHINGGNNIIILSLLTFYPVSIYSKLLFLTLVLISINESVLVTCVYSIKLQRCFSQLRNNR